MKAYKRRSEQRATAPFVLVLLLVPNDSWHPITNPGSESLSKRFHPVSSEKAQSMLPRGHHIAAPFKLLSSQGVILHISTHCQNQTTKEIICFVRVSREISVVLQDEGFSVYQHIVLDHIWFYVTSTFAWGNLIVIYRTVLPPQSSW